jgi:hypothetical protein
VPVSCLVFHSGGADRHKDAQWPYRGRHSHTSIVSEPCLNWQAFQTSYGVTSNRFFQPVFTPTAKAQIRQKDDTICLMCCINQAIVSFI